MKKKALLISAIASNQGKTLVTMALLHHFKNSVRPFKCGPDFIDPQFHAHIAKTASVNLDGYMMNDSQLRWLFQEYMDKDIAIVEGVMGYYDGMDKNGSAYDIAKTLDIPSVLVIDGSGSYITIAAVIKGMQTFRSDNTIKAVIINKVSSAMHYNLIKKHLEAETDVVVCGWVLKDLPSLDATHLGLDVECLKDEKIASIAHDVLKHIDIEMLESVMDMHMEQTGEYPFETIVQKEEKCVVVHDKNFSFLYEDNIRYLYEKYTQVVVIDATRNECIPQDADIVILPGGYVETPQAYERIKNADQFRYSLRNHAQAKKKIYAECAGLIYLGRFIDTMQMSGILPITFTLTGKRERLGYYMCVLDGKTIKGHAFHYSKVIDAPATEIKLYKIKKQIAQEGGWRVDNVFGTYLHTMWRVSGLPV